MIKTNIARQFPHHLKIGCIQRLCLWCRLLNHIKKGYCISKHNIYVTDYTEQTKNKRTIEIFTKNPPQDIRYFTLVNDKQIQARTLIFNSKSFTGSNGKPLSQCECVIFPESSDSQSWILFLELKYNQQKNQRRLNKAKQQLLDTQDYYRQAGVFQKTNTCYLLASLPEQVEPFGNFIITPVELQQLKQSSNIILRFQNSASIKDNSTINLIRN